MSNQEPTFAEKSETLKQAYAALNRNDIAAMVALFDPEVSWTEPPESPGAGTRQGRVALQSHLEWARNTWAEGTCEPMRFIPAGDKIVLFAHVHVRLKDRTDWIDGDLADVFTFRDGRVVQVRTFFDRQEALDWVRLGA